MFYFSFISSESSIFFLCSFFSSSPLHQGMTLVKGYLFSIHLILPRSNTSPRLTLLNPFPIGRDTNSQVLICVQYVSIYYCTCSFCRYFVRAPCNSSTLLCSFITGLLRLYSPILCIYRLATVMGSKVSVRIYFFIFMLMGNLKVVEFSLF